MFTSVARPQANGQVEPVNKTITHNLKMKLEDLKGRWADELPEVLWAYRTSARSTTRETLLSLAMDMRPRSLLRSEQGHYEERITNQSRMRSCNDASLISLKRNDVTLNSESQRTNNIQLDIST